jgi:heme a synthase
MASSLTSKRTADYKPFLAWFCCLALVWTTFLLYAGGFTTSIQAGMAFLDWPLSNGSINPEGWLSDRDMRAEHGHRLLGAKVGLLVIVIFAWTMLREERAYLRRLTGVALVMVILQGGLGGARVVFDQLNTAADHNVVAQTFAVAHACLAQIFLCVLVTIAVCSSRPWIENRGGLRGPIDRTTRVLGLASCGAIFLQLLVGAIMRHNHAALAIPTFPWSTPAGGILPHAWTFPITIHFAHRVGAVIVTILLVAFVWRLLRAAQSGRWLQGGAFAIVALLAVQIFLGALTVLTMKNEFAATMHMLFGAFLLAVTWVSAFLCFRLPLAAMNPTPALVPRRGGEPLGQVRA